MTATSGSPDPHARKCAAPRVRRPVAAPDWCRVGDDIRTRVANLLDELAVTGS